MRETIHGSTCFWYTFCMFRFPTKDPALVAQFARFATVGVLNTAIDWSLYFSLTRLSDFWLEHKLLANAIAFTCAATFSYVFNRRWTFRNADERIMRQVVIFFMVSIVGLLVNEGVLHLSLSVFFIGDIVGKFLATVFSMLWNFIANKTVTFREQKPPL